MRIVISSGHAKHVPGAGELIQEVPEARRVVDRVAEYVRDLGDEAIVFHDDTSKSQSANLNAIVAFHNFQARDLDVSIHFNCAGDKPVDRAIGTECCYKTQENLAAKVSEAIAQAGGFIDRGAKLRNDLAFLNGTTEPAILIEVCFVDSRADVQLYQEHFAQICAAIAATITGKPIAKPSIA